MICSVSVFLFTNDLLQWFQISDCCLCFFLFFLKQGLICFARLSFLIIFKQLLQSSIEESVVLCADSLCILRFDILENVLWHTLHEKISPCLLFLWFVSFTYKIFFDNIHKNKYNLLSSLLHFQVCFCHVFQKLWSSQQSFSFLMNSYFQDMFPEDHLFLLSIIICSLILHWPC